MRPIGSSLVFGLLAACGVAQAQDLPRELSGRWFSPVHNIGQAFSLDDIQRVGQGFAAKLTWWTSNSRCVVRGEPIQGRLTATGLSFDAITKCNDTFTVDLHRSADGWSGKAATTSLAKPIVLDLTAK